MYKKSAIKKIGSIVVVAALIASAFTVLSVENVSGDNGGSPTILINEIMYDPDTGDEWVELYNPGDTEVNLTGWYLMDAADNTFGDLTNVVIPAGGYIYVTDSGVLNNDGDTITLYDGEDTEIDSATYTDDARTGYTLEYNSESEAWEESLVAGGTPGAQNSVERTIVDAAVADADFSTLVAALQAADLVGALSGEGPFTVFAPDNDAFAALPDGVIANLLENTDVLAEILKYHVVSGEYNATEVLAADNFTTLQGEKIEVNASAVTVDGATIDAPDYALCANGIIHRIDAVMLPQAVQSSVMLDYPVGGETLGGMVPIQWSTTTPEGITLDITLEYKNDTATEWTTIAENEDNDGMYRWDVTGMSTTEQYMVRITATDSLGIPWTAMSGAFSLTDMTVTPMTTTYNETETVDVTGTTGTTNLYYPIHSIFPAGYGLKLSRDGSGGSARFSSVLFNTTGSWVIEDEGTNALFYMYVEPIELNVTASPTEVDYTKTTEGWVTVNGTVMSDGVAMSGVTVEIWEPGHTPGVGTPFATATTNADGEFTMVDVGVLNKGAGVYNITARIGPFANADAFGYTMMTVNPVTANVSLSDMADVSGGFSTGTIAFTVMDSAGSQLLPGNDYNISVWKDGELFAWHNTTGTMGGNMTFMVDGEYLNISVTDPVIWEQGDYTIMVSVDYTGNSDWEYTGEEDFTIPAPDPVNVYVMQDTLDVLAPGQNAQNITIQVLGDTRYTYGNYSNLNVGMDNKNITKRITIEGHVLYTPPKEAYYYLGDGKWNVTVFPTMGGGMIYINVSWPGNNTVAKTVDIDKGGMATISPTSVIVDDPTNLTAMVTYNDNNVFNANVTLYYETGTYGLGGMVTNGSIDGDGSAGKGSGGEYEFPDIISTQANTNIIVRVMFTSGGQDVYAYANVRSEAAHDLDAVISPDEALLGEKTTFEINVTRDGDSYGGTGETALQFYVMNETEYEKFQEDYNELTGQIMPTWDSTGNYTYTGHIDEIGTYYLYVRTTNEKHDNLDNEASMEVTAATVTADPSLLVKNVDVNKTVVFTVEWNGEPVNGTLYVHGMQEVASYEAYMDDTVMVDIVDGEGNLTNVTATAIGNITYMFKSAVSGSVMGDADGTLEVVTPAIDVSPDTVYLGEENVITLTVTHPLTGDPVPDMTVSGKFPAGMMNLGKTDSNGQVTIGIIPDMTGTITLYVEGDEAGEITVGIGRLQIHIYSGCCYFYGMPSLEKGKEYTIQVTTAGGKPIEGATVKLDGATAGTTDENGELLWEPEDDGDFTLTASMGSYADGSRDVKVKEGPSTPGFGFAALVIGLLGAALILWRRRR